jgi:hypothetical protein
MQQTVPYQFRFIALGALLAVLAAPAAVAGQTVSGQAVVVQATVFDVTGTATTVLSDTGPLMDSTDAREKSQVAGRIPSLLTGGTLHATTIGWPDEVASEASIADLVLTVGGTAIGAEFVMSRVRTAVGALAAGSADVSGLSINGIPITVTGGRNQTIPIPGGRVVINEQQTTSSGTVVNALHVVVNGVADVVIASASAAIR